MKKRFYFILFFMVLAALGTNAFAGQGAKPDHLDAENGDKGKKGDTPIFPIKLYQEYISSADGDRCVMYPTCSQYCSQAIKKHGPLLGWIMCSDRLIRGGRDETRLSDPVWVNGKKRAYDPVSNNDFWWQ
jgi:uncharacterized protein